MPSSPTGKRCGASRPSSPSESAPLVRVKHELRGWLVGLPATDRLVALLCYADGLVAAEIAAVTALPLERVEAIMARQTINLEEISRAAARVFRRWRAEDSVDGNAKARRLGAGIYTLGQVAKICGVANRTAAKWCDAGLLRCYRLPECEHRRILREDLDEFLAERGIPSQRPDLYPGPGPG